MNNFSFLKNIILIGILSFPLTSSVLGITEAEKKEEEALEREEVGRFLYEHPPIYFRTLEVPVSGKEYYPAINGMGEVLQIDGIPVELKLEDPVDSSREKFQLLNKEVVSLNKKVKSLFNYKFLGHFPGFKMIKIKIGYFEKQFNIKTGDRNEIVELYEIIEYNGKKYEINIQYEKQTESNCISENFPLPKEIKNGERFIDLYLIGIQNIRELTEDEFKAKANNKSDKRKWVLSNQALRTRGPICFRTEMSSTPKGYTQEGVATDAEGYVFKVGSEEVKLSYGKNKPKKILNDGREPKEYFPVKFEYEKFTFSSLLDGYYVVAGLASDPVKPGEITIQIGTFSKNYPIRVGTFADKDGKIVVKESVLDTIVLADGSVYEIKIDFEKEKGDWMLHLENKRASAHAYLIAIQSIVKVIDEDVIAQAKAKQQAEEEKKEKERKKKEDDDKAFAAKQEKLKEIEKKAKSVEEQEVIVATAQTEARNALSLAEAEKAADRVKNALMKAQATLKELSAHKLSEEAVERMEIAEGEVAKIVKNKRIEEVKFQQEIAEETLKAVKNSIDSDLTFADLSAESARIAAEKIEAIAWAISTNLEIQESAEKAREAAIEAANIVKAKKEELKKAEEAKAAAEAAVKKAEEVKKAAEAKVAAEAAAKKAEEAKKAAEAKVAAPHVETIKEKIARRGPRVR